MVLLFLVLGEPVVPYHTMVLQLAMVLRLNLRSMVLGQLVLPPMGIQSLVLGIILESRILHLQLVRGSVLLLRWLLLWRLVRARLGLP